MFKDFLELQIFHEKDRNVVLFTLITVIKTITTSWNVGQHLATFHYN